jgi:tetratricopeptide (TPR) repeat protein
MRTLGVIGVSGMAFSSIAERMDRRAFRSLGRGRSAEAIGHLRKALAVREKTLGKDTIDVANTLTIMAGVFAMHQGNREQAATLWRRAADIYERLGRVQSSDLDDTKLRDIRIGLKGNLENLAVYYYERGDYSDAELFFRRTVDVLREELGSDAWRGICNLRLFSDSLVRQGKDDEFESLAGTGGCD